VKTFLGSGLKSKDMVRWRAMRISALIVALLMGVPFHIHVIGSTGATESSDSTDVTGHWASAEVGSIDFQQKGNSITGTWFMGSFTGTIVGNHATFSYQESGGAKKAVCVGSFDVMQKGMQLIGSWSYTEGKESESGGFSAVRVVAQGNPLLNEAASFSEELEEVSLPEKIDQKNPLSPEDQIQIQSQYDKILQAHDNSIVSSIASPSVTSGYLFKIFNSMIGDESTKPVVFMAYQMIPSNLDFLSDDAWTTMTISGRKMYVLEEDSQRLVDDLKNKLPRLNTISAGIKSLSEMNNLIKKYGVNMKNIKFDLTQSQENKERNKLVKELSSSSSTITTEMQELQKQVSQYKQLFQMLTELQNKFNETEMSIIRNIR